MTTRERFHETMNFGHPDRVPLFMEGIREDVIREWKNQGLQQEKKLSDLFLSDSSIEIDPEFDPISYLTDFPATFLDLEKLENVLSILDLNALWEKRKEEILFDSTFDGVVFLKVHDGFFLDMGIHSWDNFSDTFVLLVEDPEFVKNIMKIQCGFIAQYIDIILKDLRVDAVIFNEPIGGNEGPLISPRMYEELALKYYSVIIDKILENGIDCIILRSYANVKILIPLILKYGFNSLWACEAESNAMNYHDIRGLYGNDLRLIGGIDLDVLRYDKELIQKEILSIVPPLLHSGGYIPLADGRIRKDIKFENYIHYRGLLEKVTNKSITVH